MGMTFQCPEHPRAKEEGAERTVLLIAPQAKRKRSPVRGGSPPVPHADAGRAT